MHVVLPITKRTLIRTEFFGRRGVLIKGGLLYIYKFIISDQALDRDIHGDRVHFPNVTNMDFMVLQCNASNKHGYVFDNAFLQVICEYMCHMGYGNCELRGLI